MNYITLSTYSEQKTIKVLFYMPMNYYLGSFIT